MAKRNNKPILELDKPKGKPIKFWDSAKAASDFYKINVVNISLNVNGTLHQAKGHYFRFATETEIELYNKIAEHLDAITSAEAAPVVENIPVITGPAPVIPEVVQPDEPQPDAQTPFARLLEESKKKFKNNSK